ncbi:hypothetical protein LWI29_004959 [Acer saccharum]|uniref:C-JID domain-containing protein n=1 Tax=Acer saccharum TaxID=4024 RepID=A0AA39SQZ0_ACESA|nr:hypothetical protein LWI29_004959 [Acer saccharum]
MVAAQVCQSQQVGRSEDSLIGVPVHSSRVRAVPVSSKGPSSILDVSAGAVVSISSAASMVEQGSKVSRDSVSSLVSFAQPIVSSVVSVDELDDRVYGRGRIPAKICYPENDIPEWFSFRSTGSLIDVKLPQHCFNYNFIWLALSVVVAISDPDHQCDHEEDEEDNDHNYSEVNYEHIVKSKDGDRYLNPLYSLFELLQFETYGMTCPPPMSNRSASLPSKANISTEDYVQLLSSMCHLPRKQPPPCLNLPYITIPNLRNKVTVTRKVTCGTCTLTQCTKLQ